MILSINLKLKNINTCYHTKRKIIKEIIRCIITNITIEKRDDLEKMLKRKNSMKNYLLLSIDGKITYSCFPLLKRLNVFPFFLTYSDEQYMLKTQKMPKHNMLPIY